MHSESAVVGKVGPNDQADEKKKKPAAAELMLETFARRYQLARVAEKEIVAVERERPTIAVPLEDGFRGRLIADYMEDHGRMPAVNAPGQVLAALGGLGLREPVTPAHLRYAPLGDAVAIDTGDDRGTVILVDADGWREHAPDGVLFQRSTANVAMPKPERGGSVEPLLDLLNATEDDRALIVGWMVTAMLPDVNTPILLFGGEQGTGKTTAAGFVRNIIDPSRATVMPPPDSCEKTAIQAGAMWCLAYDNLSGTATWFSDQLCRLATGDSYPRRQLYRDRDLVIDEFRRPVILTSISPGAMRGDLAERVLNVELEPIDDQHRRDEIELRHAFAAMRSRVFGGLLDLLSAVIRELPRVELDEKPRMAGFAKVLAALDRAAPQVTGDRALAAYLERSDKLAEDVVELNPVLEAVRELAAIHLNGWEGTMKELLGELNSRLPESEKRPAGWPKSAKGLQVILTNGAKALRQGGVDVRKGERLSKGQLYRITPTRAAAAEPTPDFVDDMPV